MKICKETSEKSSRINKLIPLFAKNNYIIIEFEGYTIKNNKISLLLDKYYVEELNSKYKLTQELLDKIIEIEGKEVWEEKVNLSKQANVPYNIVLYSYPIINIFIYEVVDKNQIKLIHIFNSLESFGKWCFTFRDLQMTSRYEEEGLPKFDQDLRKIGKSWPGNLDCVLYKKEEGIKAIVEFQTTIKTEVAKHSNNKYFLATPQRKGDEQRWFVLDIVRKHFNKSLIIIVWSPAENIVKLKKVSEIIYSRNNKDKKPGLYYSYTEILEINDLIKNMESIL